MEPVAVGGGGWGFDPVGVFPEVAGGLVVAEVVDDEHGEDDKAAEDVEGEEAGGELRRGGRRWAKGTWEGGGGHGRGILWIGGWGLGIDGGILRVVDCGLGDWDC